LGGVLPVKIDCVYSDSDGVAEALHV